MTNRVAGVIACVAALMVAVAPAFPWFEASIPAGSLSITGLGASGSLWTLPALGALALLVGLACAAAGAGLGPIEARWAGGALVALGALACFWALREALDPPVEVVVIDGATPRSATIPTSVLPAAVIAPAAAGILAAAGIAIARPWRSR